MVSPSPGEQIERAASAGYARLRIDFVLLAPSVRRSVADSNEIESEGGKPKGSPLSGKINIDSIASDVVVGADVVEQDKGSVTPSDVDWGGENSKHPVNVNNLPIDGRVPVPGPNPPPPR